MCRVLIVDDDPDTLEGFATVLRYSGFEVATADCGRHALIEIRRGSVGAVLADLRLPDMSGLDLLRAARSDGVWDVPFVLVTGFASSSSAIEAIRLGVVDYIEKPVIGDELIRVVNSALAAMRKVDSISSACATFETHAASRWSDLIMPIILAPSDLKTIAAWGRAIGKSEGAIKNWCQMIDITPRDSLNLGRLLRALIRHRSEGYPLEESLDVVDRRTLRALLKAGGIASNDPRDFPRDICEFLGHQTLVLDPYAVRELRQRLERHFSHIYTRSHDAG